MGSPEPYLPLRSSWDTTTTEGAMANDAHTGYDTGTLHAGGWVLTQYPDTDEGCDKSAMTDDYDNYTPEL